MPRARDTLPARVRASAGGTTAQTRDKVRNRRIVTHLPGEALDTRRDFLKLLTFSLRAATVYGHLGLFDKNHLHSLIDQGHIYE